MIGFSLRRPRRQPAHHGPRVFTDSRGNDWTVQAKAPARQSALLTAPVAVPADDTITDWGPGFDRFYDQVTAELEAAGKQAEAADGEPHGIAAPEVLVALIARAAAQAPPFTGASAVGQMTPPSQAAAPTEPWGVWDRPDGLLMNEQDGYAPPARPYVPDPEPHVPSIPADYRSLPAFRAAVRKGCREGWRGIGVRTASFAPPPDFDFIAMMRAHYTGPVTVLPRHLVAWDDAEAGIEVAA